MHPVLPFPALAGFDDTCRVLSRDLGDGATGVQVLGFRGASWRGVCVCKLVEVCALHPAGASCTGAEWMIAAHDGKSWPQCWFRALWFDFALSSLSGD